MPEPQAKPEVPAPTAKRKRLSKNKKKTWRTLSRDVDEILPQQTKLEVAKRRSGSFFLDIGGAGQKRQVDVSEPLRCHSSLAPNAPPPAVPKRLKKLDEQRVQKLAKSAAAIAGRGATKRPAEEEDKSESASAYDLWDAASDTVVDDSEQVTLRQQHLRSIGQLPVKRRVRTPKADLPSCLVPDSGASFNPSLDSHQQLLRQVESEELLVERREAKLRNQLDRHFPNQSKAKLQQQEIAEMSAGLFDGGDSEGEEAEGEKAEEDDEVVTIGQNSSKNNREVRRQQAEARERKRQKRLVHELRQITAVSRRVEAGEAESQKRQAEKLAKRLLAARGTKRLGRQRFTEVEKQFQLPEELRSTLREVKPHGDLFVDAVKGLQRRNVLEPRQRAKWRPRYKPKRIPKKNRAGEELRAGQVRNTPAKNA